MRILLILLILGNGHANEQLARVIDKDGFTNVRTGQGLSFDIIEKVTTNDFFYCEIDKDSDWFKVKLLKWHSGDQITGYIHKSRIQIIEELSNEEQTRIILDVLHRQKLLADRFVESHAKYNNQLKRWNTTTDSILYRTAVAELELYSETGYSPILQLLPKTFCRTGDRLIISGLFSTVWSDKGSANEGPSFVLGECFACNVGLMSEQINKLKIKEQKKLIIDDIEWGLLNKYNVDDRKTLSDPDFIKLKKHLDLVRD